MTRQIRLNGFVVNGPAHPVPGLWRHPRNRAIAHGGLGYWTKLAELLERGRFDALVITDDAREHHAGGDASEYDPLMLVSALAHVTRHLGFAVSASTAQEIPAVLARRLSSLDHLTQGRIGWHVVPGSAPGGKASQDSERLGRAQEFLEIGYALWQGSWQPGAVVRDRASGVFARPEKVHRVSHAGRHFRLETFHLTEPSPQRTPFLLADAESAEERDFAARHAEAVFIAAETAAAAARIAGDIRKRARQAGRDPARIVIFARATVVVGPTDRAVQARLADYRGHVESEAALAFFARRTGEDLSETDPDAPVADRWKSDIAREAVAAALASDPIRAWTLRDVAAQAALGAGGALIAGTPVEIADRLEAWADEAGIDGFNLADITADDLADFVDLVVPELQRRGVLKRDYAGGTLRERFQGDPHPHESHPAAAFSGIPEAAAAG